MMPPMPSQFGYPSVQGPTPQQDYANFLGVYQKAFQEIIEFKNQYVEEIMRMRERMVQEREEILEYERMKQQ